MKNKIFKMINRIEKIRNLTCNMEDAEYYDEVNKQLNQLEKELKEMVI